MSREHPVVADPRRWRLLRRRILNRDGWRCRKCHKAGRLEVDHVVPIQAGGAWWDPSNLQTLDRACHFAKTAGENTHPVPPDVLAWHVFLRT